MCFCVVYISSLSLPNPTLVNILHSFQELTLSLVVSYTLISNQPMAFSLSGKMGEVSLTNESTYQRTPFGKEMLKHFCFDPSFKNLNHGIQSSSISSQSFF